MTLHACEGQGNPAAVLRNLVRPTISGACATMLRSALC